MRKAILYIDKNTWDILQGCKLSLGFVGVFKSTDMVLTSFTIIKQLRLQFANVNLQNAYFFKKTIDKFYKMRI